jgi:hypothetical protein
MAGWSYSRPAYAADPRPPNKGGKGGRGCDKWRRQEENTGICVEIVHRGLYRRSRVGSGGGKIRVGWLAGLREGRGRWLEAHPGSCDSTPGGAYYYPRKRLRIKPFGGIIRAESVVSRCGRRRGRSLARPKSEHLPRVAVKCFTRGELAGVGLGTVRAEPVPDTWSRAACPPPTDSGVRCGGMHLTTANMDTTIGSAGEPGADPMGIPPARTSRR